MIQFTKTTFRWIITIILFAILAYLFIAGALNPPNPDDYWDSPRSIQGM